MSNLDDLQTKGITSLHPNLDSQSRQNIHEYLLDHSMRLGCHVPGYWDGKDMVGTRQFLNEPEIYFSRIVASYPFDVAVNCPHLVRYSLSHIDLIEQYLEAEPVMYSVNIWWNFPGSELGYVSKPHIDYDDKRFLTMLFYLDDMDHSNCHVYNDEKFIGPAGTVLLEDGGRLHYGVKPLKPRLAAWVRFGVSEIPPIYLIEGNYRAVYSNLDSLTFKDKRIMRSVVVC